MADDAGFAAFVRANSASLFGTAYLLTGSADRAEELLQDTLARLYPRWDRVQAAEAPLAYVRRCVANRFVSSRRGPSARDVSLHDLPEMPDAGSLAVGWPIVACSGSCWAGCLIASGQPW